jgi:hypothetical protein
MRKIGYAVFCSLLWVATSGVPVLASVDLAIGLDKKTDRPNLFIAWRNTERILEVELDVKNYGDEQGSGKIVVYILDEEGAVLDSSPGPANKTVSVAVPPYRKGGKEGKIVQMHGSKSLNLLIDRLDRANVPYSLKAAIITDQPDANPLNNMAVRSFNVNSRARPGCIHFRDYYLRNQSDRTVDLVWKVDTSAIPKGWQVTTVPKDGQTVQVKPSAVVQGHAYIKTPDDLHEGDHVDLRFMAVDKRDNSVFGQSEWFLVYDISPPDITGLSYSIDKETSVVEVSLTATDLVSFLKEASGCRVEYSTDGGTTFSNKILAYLDGNFVGPTRFRGELGPFAPRTRLVMSVIVEDIAGNRSQRAFEPIVVGSRSALGDRLAAAETARRGER